MADGRRICSWPALTGPSHRVAFTNALCCPHLEAALLPKKWVVSSRFVLRVTKSPSCAYEKVVAAESAGTIGVEEEGLAIPGKRWGRIVRRGIQNAIPAFGGVVVVDVDRYRPRLVHVAARRHPEVKTADRPRAGAGDHHLQPILAPDGRARIAQRAAEFRHIRSRTPQLPPIATVEIGVTSADVNVESVARRIRRRSHKIAREIEVERSRGLILEEGWTRIVGRAVQKAAEIDGCLPAEIVPLVLAVSGP